MADPPRPIGSLSELEDAIRHGYMVVSVDGLTPNGTNELRAEYEARFAALPAVIQDLRDMLANVDRFAVFGQVTAWFIENQSDPSASDRMLATLEMVATLILEQPTRAAPGYANKGLMAAQLSRLLEGISELLMFTPEVVVGSPAGDDDPLRHLAERFVTRELYNPISSADWKEEQLLSEIAAGERLSSELCTVAGLDGSSALSAYRALVAFTLESLREWSATTRGLPVEVAGCQLSDHLCFRPEDLVDRGVEPVAAARFCQVYSQPLGSNAFPLLGMTDAIRARPVLRDGHDGFLCVSPPLLLRALRPRLRSLLNPDDPDEPGSVSGFRLWVKREDHIVAEMAAGALRQVGFRSIGREAKWQTADDESDVDVWAALEGYLLPIQIKTGRLHRWRSIKTLTTDLKKLVTDAIQQDERFRGAYGSEDFAWRSSSAPPTDSELIPPVVLTLEDVSGCSVASVSLRDAGLTEVVQLPWIVSLAHFEQASELLDTSAVFLHFLRRRTILSEHQIISAGDEMDLVLEYLSHGFELATEGRPRWEGIPIRHALIDQPWRTYDPWLAGWEGVGPPAPKPALPTPPAMADLLRRLDRDRPAGFLGMSIALLDVPRSLWDHVASAWEHVSAPLSSPTSQQVADPAFAFADGRRVGFTFLRWRPADRRRPDFASVLSKHCAVQKYRAKADQWYGVMVPPTSSDSLGPLLTLRRPWRQDPLEAASAEAYIRRLQHGL